jgi:hypothetical protein
MAFLPLVLCGFLPGRPGLPFDVSICVLWACRKTGAGAPDQTGMHSAMAAIRRDPPSTLALAARRLHICAAAQKSARQE